MNRVFQFGQGFEVPDHTFLFEMLGPRQQHLEGKEVVDAMSVAMGDLPPGISSSLHVHPLVAHLAWVLTGELSIQMKDPGSAEPYRVDVKPHEAAYTAPGTFMQLINRGATKCQVLYFVAPAFVFEQDDTGKVLYNDAHVLDLGWEQLASNAWRVPEIEDIDRIRQERAASLKRLSTLARRRSLELAKQRL